MTKTLFGVSKKRLSKWAYDKSSWAVSPLLIIGAFAYAYEEFRLWLIGLGALLILIKIILYTLIVRHLRKNLIRLVDSTYTYFSKRLLNWYKLYKIHRVDYYEETPYYLLIRGVIVIIRYNPKTEKAIPVKTIKSIKVPNVFKKEIKKALEDKMEEEKRRQLTIQEVNRRYGKE